MGNRPYSDRELELLEYAPRASPKKEEKPSGKWRNVYQLSLPKADIPYFVVFGQPEWLTDFEPPEPGEYPAQAVWPSKDVALTKRDDFLAPGNWELHAAGLLGVKLDDIIQWVRVEKE